MEFIKSIWGQRTPAARIGLIVGAMLIVVAAAGIGIWSYRADYQVLFSDVTAGDAASMVAELDRMKVPYQLSDGGNTILVPKEMVYKTRLKLMSKDIPLHGAVGFEVFNNADFGMTEFVQKVNYQRAIQGELTRTILSIEEIQSARVHLAMPEQGLFKKASSKPKASVTIAMKPGHVLAPPQIAGIQRLVAASVPEIVAEDVTVLDQHGVALSRVASSEAGGDFAGAQLDSKRGVEEYLLRKVNQVLDRTLGAGEAIASVDVVLNMDQNRVTTEEVLAAKNGDPDAAAAGVMVRERQTTRDSGDTQGNGKSGQGSSVTSVESDYQVGRRVSQSVTAAGAVRRMTVAVVVKKPLNDEQLERVKEVVGLAVGLDAQRGDAVAVHSMERLAAGAGGGSTLGTLAEDANFAGDKVALTPSTELANGNPAPSTSAATWVLGVLLAGAVLAGIAFVVRSSLGNAAARRSLGNDERERLLLEIRQWMDSGSEQMAEKQQ